MHLDLVLFPVKRKCLRLLWIYLRTGEHSCAFGVAFVNDLVVVTPDLVTLIAQLVAKWNISEKQDRGVGLQVSSILIERLGLFPLSFSRFRN